MQFAYLNMTCKALLDTAANYGMKPDKDRTHQVSFAGLDLTPSDCVSIGYFMRVNSLLVREESSILFQPGICSDVGMAMLMKELRKGVNGKTPTQFYIRVMNTELGEASLSTLKDFLCGQSNIGALNITHDCLNSRNMVIAMKSIVEGLASDSSCHGISLSEVKSSHVHYLTLLLQCCSLKSLYLYDADLQKGMSLFSEALKLSAIVTLHLKNCGIDDSGLIHLGKAISANMHLIELQIPENPACTANGMAAFLTCLVDSPSPLLSMVIDDHIFHVLNKQPENPVLFQNQTRKGFYFIPYSLMYYITTSDAHLNVDPRDSDQPISKIEAMFRQLLVTEQ